MAETYLVTGARGGLGRMLVAALRSGGSRVLALDVVPGGHADDIEGSFYDPNLIADITGQVAGIFHLAAVSGVGDGEKDPSRCLEVNLIGFTRLCQAASQSKQQPWIVSASTIEVLHYIDSGTIADVPHVYGFSKFAAEGMAQYFAGKTGLRVVSARLSTLYGFPGAPPAKVLPIFVRKALASETLTIMDNSGWYNFLHSEDAVAALMQVGVRAGGLAAGRNEAYLFCGTETLSLAELARRVIARLGSVSKLEAPPGGTPQDSVRPDLPARSPGLPGWRAEINLDTGIDRLAAQFRCQ